LHPLICVLLLRLDHVSREGDGCMDKDNAIDRRAGAASSLPVFTQVG
jgi:hypothetical protein